MAESRLLECCGSTRWARRIVRHRPYPDLGALLAAADEAYYDLTPAQVSEAVACETPVGLWQPAGGRPDVRSAGFAARTAMQAAHAAYERQFGHAFVICLDDVHANDKLDHVLAAIRTRLGHDTERERAVTADELRRVVRGRLARRLADHPEWCP
ncbi:2-oxo-4-hydroxy-4-carboxy-5-ureidoimidazoline decarboxylase [Streptomyces meridianus]|uniref:2-oxo-4-hydroxy-4-carboxy-5-ureidoimidazoline decarboxylase n=1 Tax=Streptomyces meridianus TaxID=2938945 RepID=UPI003555ED90